MDYYLVNSGSGSYKFFELDETIESGLVSAPSLVFSCFRDKNPSSQPIIRERNCHFTDLLPIAFEGVIDQKLAPNTTEEEYKGGVERIVEGIEGHKYDKVVLARTEFYASDLSPFEVFKALSSLYPTAYVYLLSSRKLGTWIGASPELLLRSSEGRVSTMSLAGTRAAATSNLWGSKERDEQQIVTDGILSVFEKNKIIDTEVDGPHTKNAGAIEHLSSSISGKLSDSSALSSLITDLHPTPAICGSPQDVSMAELALLESFDREFFAGYLGISNGDDLELHVNIRCGKAVKGGFQLFAGAGINASSDPEMEWKETQRKLEVFKKASLPYRS